MYSASYLCSRFISLRLLCHVSVCGCAQEVLFAQIKVCNEGAPAAVHSRTALELERAKRAGVLTVSTSEEQSKKYIDAVQSVSLLRGRKRKRRGTS